MDPYHFFEEELRNVARTMCCLAGDEVTHLTKPVHYHIDTIQPYFFLGSPTMKSILIHSHGLLGMGRGW